MAGKRSHLLLALRTLIRREPSRRVAPHLRDQEAGIDLVFVIVLALSIGLVAWLGVFIMTQVEAVMFENRWKSSAAHFLSNKRSIACPAEVASVDYFGVENSVSGVDQEYTVMLAYLRYLAQGVWVILTSGDPFKTNRIERVMAYAVRAILPATEGGPLDYEVLQGRSNLGADVTSEFPYSLAGLGPSITSMFLRVGEDHPEDFVMYVVIVERKSAVDDSISQLFQLVISKPCGADVTGDNIPDLWGETS